MNNLQKRYGKEKAKNVYYALESKVKKKRKHNALAMS
jgi:hypothetical protein